MTKPNLEQTIALMKAEILRDIAIGRVPKTVASFSELHDYVDANYYGGFCDDKYVGEMWKAFGCTDDDGCPEEWYDFVNAAQNAINLWLRDNGAQQLNIQQADFVYVQSQAAAGNWVDSIGASSIKRALEHKQYLEARGETARVVAKTYTVIA